MRTKYKTYPNEGLYFTTSTIIEFIPIFLNKTMFDIIIDSLKFCKINKGLNLFAFVIMDNHFHAIVSGDNLPDIFRDFKRFTAGKIIEAAASMKSGWLLNQFEFWKKEFKINSQYQIWQEGYHPQLITNEEMLLQKIEYIHNNPVKRGFVDKAENWKYSSARNFLGDNSLIEIDSLY